MMKFLPALVFSVALSSSVSSKAADEKVSGPADLNSDKKKVTLSLQERCIQQLEKGNKDYTYKFIKSGSELEYEIVEIPKEKKSDSYIRYYSASGFAEVNARTATCNHTGQKKDVKSKFLDIFKSSDDAAVKLQKDTDAAIRNFNGNKSTYISGLATFRDVCARAFPLVKDYLVSKGQLPKDLKTTGSGDCTDPNSTAPCPAGQAK